MDEGFSMKETLVRVEAKVDALAVSVAATQLAVATHAPRIEALETAADRRWSLLPTWIASGVALVLAALPYLHH